MFECGGSSRPGSATFAGYATGTSAAPVGNAGATRGRNGRATAPGLHPATMMIHGSTSAIRYHEQTGMASTGSASRYGARKTKKSSAAAAGGAGPLLHTAAAQGQLAAVELADRCRRSAATSSDAARAAASSAGPALPGGPAPADAECEARDGPAPAHADPRLPGRPRRSHHGARVARRRRRSAQRAMRSMSRSWRRTRYSQGYSLRTPRSGAAAAPDAAAAAPRRSPPRGIAAQALDA